MEPDLSKLTTRALVGKLVAAKLVRARLADLRMDMLHVGGTLWQVPESVDGESISEAGDTVRNIMVRLDHQADMLLKEIYRRTPE